jgi:hypothetical protein
MFNIEIDGLRELNEKLLEYARQLAELHSSIPAELLEWQREDMRRRYPNMTVDSSNQVTSSSTSIWPTSRLADSHKAQPKLKSPRQYRPTLFGPKTRSDRPILRAELQDRLYDRMRDLVSEAVKWP